MVQNISINITFKSVLIVLGVIALVWALSTFSSIMFLLFIAILLAVAISPLLNRFEAQRVPRWLGILLIYVILFAIVCAAFGLLVPLLIEETTHLIENLPEIAQNITGVVRNRIAAIFPA